MRLSRPGLLVSAALISLTACSAYRLPFTQHAGVSQQADPRQATVVFLWPSTSCDPAGYFTLATAKGQFLGTMSSGSRLSVLVPAGESTFIGWNDVMETATGWLRKETLPVLRADLHEGRTYYVRLALGEWDARGPAQSWWGRAGRGAMMRRCMGGPQGATSAMIALSPEQKGREEIREWMAKLDPITPDRAAGQAWLDDNRQVLDAHLAVGQGRYVDLRPEAKALATIGPADGEPR